MILSQTQDFFGPDSPLKNASGDFTYEPRPQQVAMACAIAEALDNERNLCVEAPTGVGKTFAYLVPALFHAKKQDKPVIVSTHTIHLQEQIIQRDVPFLEKLLGRHINAVVAKGRSNYLCLRKLADIADMDAELLPGAEAIDDIAKLTSWAENTTTGDHGDMTEAISPNLWNAVASERGNCLNAKCEFFESCFLMKARRRVAQAELIIANHAFFFAALAMQDHKNGTPDDDKQEKLLPEPAAVIIDEGHTLEDNAANHLALRGESFVINKLLNRLYNRERATGLLADNAFLIAQDAINLAKHKASLFFTQILQWLEPQHKDPLRYTVPGHIPDYLAEPLQTVEAELDTIIHRLTEDEATLKTELQALMEAIGEQRVALSTFFNMSLPDYVYWMETQGKDKTDLAFLSVPVNVAPLLQEKLFATPPVIVTSATLAVNNSLDFFLNRVGGTDAEKLILDSPFDYPSQVTLYIARDMPDPRSDAFLTASVEHLKHFLKQTAGRAFVLFTSYRSLNDTARLIEPFCRKEHYTLLKQGDGMSPRKMIQQFRKLPHAVILGTSSFWTGVDVPGEALSNVIITKLPFAVPDHPLIEARAERARANGRNDFMEYSVPEAVLKFRQGFGRLIRSRSDTGIVVILDSRIITKHYGKSFLNSIPSCPIEYV